MYAIKKINRYEEISPHDVIKVQRDVMEEISEEHSTELKKLIEISKDYETVLTWHKYSVPSCVQLYVDTVGDEDLFALVAVNIPLPFPIDSPRTSSYDVKRVNVYDEDEHVAIIIVHSH